MKPLATILEALKNERDFQRDFDPELADRLTEIMTDLQPHVDAERARAV